MDVFQAIRKRRAVRHFRPDAVSREQVHAVLDAANQAPSGLNRQPWEFLVVTGEKIREMGKSYHSTLTEYLNNWEASPMSRSLSCDEFIRFSETYGGAPVVIVLLVKADPIPTSVRPTLRVRARRCRTSCLQQPPSGLGPAG